MELDNLPSEKVEVEVEVEEDAKSNKSSRSNASSFSNFHELRPMASKNPKTIEEL